MNISSFTINNSTGINANNSKKAIDGLKINKEIQNFVSYYPIFSTIYFSCIAQLDKKHIEQKTYDDKITYARRIYNLTCLIMSEVSNDIKFNFSTDFDVSYNNLMHRVHSIKQFFFNAHILHLHFTQYRHIIIERDSMSKTSYEREGFVELYNEQYMDSKEFFNRLITPFKRDFLENRVFNEWKRLFYGPRFSKTSKISYWIEFDAFWIGMLRPKADKMIKNVWNDIAKSAKLRW
jgi:hypothetical protein